VEHASTCLCSGQFVLTKDEWRHVRGLNLLDQTVSRLTNLFGLDRINALMSLFAQHSLNANVRESYRVLFMHSMSLRQKMMSSRAWFKAKRIAARMEDRAMAWTANALLGGKPKEETVIVLGAARFVNRGECESVYALDSTPCLSRRSRCRCRSL